MTSWTERILQAFPEDLSPFWIASDPDNLLLDERILQVLRDRGFEVLPFEDPIAFRVEYEERYRAAWDNGALGTCKALVLQFPGTDLSILPWGLPSVCAKSRPEPCRPDAQAELQCHPADR